jgi:hypothetical protein
METKIRIIHRVPKGRVGWALPTIPTEIKVREEAGGM